MKCNKRLEHHRYTFELELTNEEHTLLVYVTSSAHCVADAVKKDMDLPPTERDEMIHTLDNLSDILNIDKELL